MWQDIIFLINFSNGIKMQEGGRKTVRPQMVNLNRATRNQNDFPPARHESSSGPEGATWMRKCTFSPEFSWKQNHPKLGDLRASPMAQRVKNPPAMKETQEMWVRSLGWDDPLERKWQHTPVSLPGKSHGQKSLVGYSPWDHKELDMTDSKPI